jgi:hypothetical protein
MMAFFHYFEAIERPGAASPEPALPLKESANYYVCRFRRAGPRRHHAQRTAAAFHLQ